MTLTREVTVVELGGGKGNVTVKSVGVASGPVDVGIEGKTGVCIGGGTTVGKGGGSGGTIEGNTGHPPQPGKPLSDIQVYVSFLRSVRPNISRSSQPVEAEYELSIAYVQVNKRRY